MNHRQDLILKRDLLDKEAECIDKQGTQIANQPNKPAITCVLQNCLRKLVCFFFFPPPQTASFTPYARLIWTTRMRHLPLQTLSQHRGSCPWHSRPWRFCRTGDSLLHLCAKNYLCSSIPVLVPNFSLEILKSK